MSHNDILTPILQGRGLSQFSDLNNAVGGLSALVNKSTSLLGLFKNLDENNNATITADKAQVQSLTKQAINLKFDMQRQQDQLTEAQHRLNAVQAHITACNNDVAAIQNAEAIDAHQLNLVAGATSNLFDMIARASEFVVRYVFLAARALDVFAFTDAAVVTPSTAPAQPLTNVSQLSLDFGIISPDVIADGLLGIQQQNPGPVVSMCGSLDQNWATAPAWSAFTNQGINLANALTPGQVWILITDPAVLSQLQSTGSTNFEIDLINLPTNTRELKISRMYVNLPEATASVPSLNGELTHAGYAYALRHSDNATLLMGSRPMTSFVSVGLTSGQIPPAPTGPILDAELQEFYVRSPATRWSFTVNDPNPHNLTAVSEIQVGLEFLAMAYP